MFVRLASLSLFVLFAVPVPAEATVGENTVIELLGYDPAERKVFALAHEVETPGLLVMDLRRGDDARFVTSRRWARFDYDEREQKLAALRRRLVPLRRIPRGDLTIRVHDGARSRVWSEWHETHIHLRTMTTHIDYGWLTGSRSFEVITGFLRPYRGARLRLRGAYEIPGEDVALAIVSAFTDSSEGGYFVDEAVLLRR